MIIRPRPLTPMGSSGSTALPWGFDYRYWLGGDGLWYAGLYDYRPIIKKRIAALAVGPHPTTEKFQTVCQHLKEQLDHYEY